MLEIKGNKNFLLFLSRINIEGSFWEENCRYIQVSGNTFDGINKKKFDKKDYHIRTFSDNINSCNNGTI